jgi:hypothetical protein
VLNHQISLHELEVHGVRGIANLWFKTYLSNYSQFVEITRLETSNTKNRYFSSLKKSAYGVPQGSILGPILFILCINDLPRNVHNADNTNALVLDKDLKSLAL